MTIGNWISFHGKIRGNDFFIQSHSLLSLPLQKKQGVQFKEFSALPRSAGGQGCPCASKWTPRTCVHSPTTYSVGKALPHFPLPQGISHSVDHVTLGISQGYIILVVDSTWHWCMCGAVVFIYHPYILPCCRYPSYVNGS